MLVATTLWQFHISLTASNGTTVPTAPGPLHQCASLHRESLAKLALLEKRCPTNLIQATHMLLKFMSDPSSIDAANNLEEVLLVFARHRWCGHGSGLLGLDAATMKTEWLRDFGSWPPTIGAPPDAYAADIEQRREALEILSDHSTRVCGSDFFNLSIRSL